MRLVDRKILASRRGIFLLLACELNRDSRRIHPLIHKGEKGERKEIDTNFKGETRFEKAKRVARLPKRFGLANCGLRTAACKLRVAKGVFYLPALRDRGAWSI